MQGFIRYFLFSRPMVRYLEQINHIDPGSRHKISWFIRFLITMPNSKKRDVLKRKIIDILDLDPKLKLEWFMLVPELSKVQLVGSNEENARKLGAEYIRKTEHAEDGFHTSVVLHKLHKFEKDGGDAFIDGCFREIASRRDGAVGWLQRWVYEYEHQYGSWVGLIAEYFFCKSATENGTLRWLCQNTRSVSFNFLCGLINMAMVCNIDRDEINVAVKYICKEESLWQEKWQKSWVTDDKTEVLKGSGIKDVAFIIYDVGTVRAIFDRFETKFGEIDSLRKEVGIPKIKDLVVNRKNYTDVSIMY